MAGRTSKLAATLEKYERDIIKSWLEYQLSTTTARGDLLKESELRDQSQKFFKVFRDAVSHDGAGDLQSRTWTDVRDFLKTLSQGRAKLGFSPSETATFVFSLKQPLFDQLREEHKADAAGLTDDLWMSTTLLDKLGLFTFEQYLKGREEIISRQQQELLELSTPVVRLWGGVLALPLIGTLDSARTQVVMESLLERIVETGSTIAIIDITGVPLVDTAVAQHLLKTVAAARLMGADCIISGIKPQIAQTIVHLGIDLTDVITKSTLADAFSVALQRLGLAVVSK
jgi:rsbT co-antagonist protein RsbR